MCCCHASRLGDLLHSFECPAGFDVVDVVVAEVATGPGAVLARLSNRLELGQTAATKVRALLMQPEPLAPDVVLGNGPECVAWRSALDAAAQAGGNVVEWRFNLCACSFRDRSEFRLCCRGIVRSRVGSGFGQEFWFVVATGFRVVTVPDCAIFAYFPLCNRYTVTKPVVIGFLAIWTVTSVSRVTV